MYYIEMYVVSVDSMLRFLPRNWSILVSEVLIVVQYTLYKQ